MLSKPIMLCQYAAYTGLDYLQFGQYTIIVYMAALILKACANLRNLNPRKPEYPNGQIFG